jgi:hypothetical protein
MDTDRERATTVCRVDEPTYQLLLRSNHYPSYRWYLFSVSQAAPLLAKEGLGQGNRI